MHSPSENSGEATARAQRCPCLSGLPYAECCAPLHHGTTVAQTAEALMRSRYSAFSQGLPQYLLDTWHESTRPSALELDASIRWYRLDLHGRERGGPLDVAGVVEFEAYWRSPDDRGSHRERSTFVRESGRWYYVDGSR